MGKRWLWSGRCLFSTSGDLHELAFEVEFHFFNMKKGKGVLLDSKDQQVETGSIQNSAFLNAVVKVYCTHTAPDYSLPWQKQRQYKSTGSALMIADGKFLTNAHCVQHDTQGDVIVSFDGVHVGCEGTVPFRSSEHIAFCYLISQKFAGDSVEVGIIRAGEFMKVQAVLKPRVHLVPYHIEGGQPSYLVVAGLVFTPLSIPLIHLSTSSEVEVWTAYILPPPDPTKWEYTGFVVVVVVVYSLMDSRIGHTHPWAMAEEQDSDINLRVDDGSGRMVLANEVNIGYEDMSYEQVLKLNGTRIKHSPFGSSSGLEEALSASASILKDYGIPAERSSDLLDHILIP
ncbi:putative protease Do-like 2, chloroplastic-like isoform X2 [Capsicum annuum]|nr:putative protease Do-like 2, chloroplastic-like isoform X2 [Capsicum annuum]